jgi:hypothetical protein
MLDKAEVMKWISNQSLSQKQRYLLSIWFQDVWGFDIMFKKALTAYYQDPRHTLETKFRLILALAWFYDVSLTQLHRIQLNLVSRYEDCICFRSWNRKQWLVLPPIFKQIVLRLIFKGKQCIVCNFKYWIHGNNQFISQTTTKEILDEYFEIEEDFDPVVASNSTKVNNCVYNWEKYPTEKSSRPKIQIYADNKDDVSSNLISHGFEQVEFEKFEPVPILRYIFPKLALIKWESLEQ